MEIVIKKSTNSNKKFDAIIDGKKKISFGEKAYRKTRTWCWAAGSRCARHRSSSLTAAPPSPSGASIRLSAARLGASS